MSLALRGSLGALRARPVPATLGLARRMTTARVPARPTLAVSRPRTPNMRFRFSTVSPGTMPPAPEPPKTAYQRFKELTKTYGSYAVIMYLALSAVDFSISFAVVHAVGADRIEPYVHSLVQLYRRLRHGEEGAAALEVADEAKKRAQEAEEAAEAATSGKLRKNDKTWWNNKALWAELALAYSIHKIGLLPVRAGLTVAWTPKVVNFLSARGWIGKGGYRRAAQHGAAKAREGADKMREAGARAMERAKDATKRP